MLLGTMTGLHDWMKENMYYFLGPHMLNRLVSTALAAGVGTFASIPFDAIRIRLYLQRQLPNGVWPYNSTVEVFNKMTKYEANHKHSGNMNCFHLGFITQFLRYFIIFYMSQYILDHYQLNNYVEEYWVPSRYSHPTAIAFNVSEPYTLSFHKGLISYT